MKKHFIYDDGGQAGTVYAEERRTCTVRALAIAARISFEQAHMIMRLAGRKPGKGGRVSLGLQASGILHEYMAIGLYGRDEFCGYKHSGNLFPTLKRILPALASGNYILIANHHAFAVINGKIHDTFPQNGNRRVKYCIRIKPGWRP